MSLKQTHANLRVAGRQEPDGYMKAVAEAAVTAVNENYTPTWEDDKVVTEALVKGQCGHTYTVLITFEGRLNEGVMEDVETEFGTVEFKGFLGDGVLDLGVTPNLDSKYTQDILSNLTPGSWVSEDEIRDALSEGDVRWAGNKIRHLSLLSEEGLVEKDGLNPYVYRLTDSGSSLKEQLNEK